jgi:hypothetical protein
MKILKAWGISLLLVMLLLSVIGPAAAVTTKTKALGGNWTEYQKVEEGIALALPQGWAQLDLDAQTLNASMDVIAKKNPEMALMLEGQAKNLIMNGVKFFGFHATPEATAQGYATNVNVIKQAMPADFSLDVMVQATIAQMENMSTIQGPISHQRVKTRQWSGEEMHYTMTMNSENDAVLEIAITQYMVLYKQNCYIITMGALKDQAGKYETIFKQIGGSFRIL